VFQGREGSQYSYSILVLVKLLVTDLCPAPLVVRPRSPRDLSEISAAVAAVAGRRPRRHPAAADEQRHHDLLSQRTRTNLSPPPVDAPLQNNPTPPLPFLSLPRLPRCCHENDHPVGLMRSDMAFRETPTRRSRLAARATETQIGSRDPDHAHLGSTHSLTHHKTKTSHRRPMYKT